MNKASQETRCFEFSGKAEIERETRVVSRQDLIRFKFNGNKSICGMGGWGRRRYIFQGLKCCFDTSKFSRALLSFIFRCPPVLW